jgi:chemotaxis protein methyltransferase CheR
VNLLAAPIRSVTLREFSLFRTLVEREIGIHLHDSKQALLNARLLPRLRELGLSTFSEYYERVVNGGDEELSRLISAICTNETQFFREPGHFELLRQNLVPRLLEAERAGQRGRTLRIWSAGCSTGEEPYSLAMLLLDVLPSTWKVEILATDISTKVLNKAVEAVYPMRRFSEIPDPLRRKFVLLGVGQREGFFRVAPEVRACVQFARLNLVPSEEGHVGSFDFVFCRNVLIYFSAATRRRVVSWLCSQVKPGGYLWAGHSESLHDLDPRLRTVIPTVYRVEQSAS